VGTYILRLILTDGTHDSAYFFTLIVEPGTRLAAQVARGEVAQPSDDVAANRYELIDRHLTAAGFGWYEVSNWAKPGGECKHNINYWHNQDWLGIGPGAHAHHNGLRSWMTKHPAAWALKVDNGESPIAGSEVLSAQEIANEELMLGLRLREGIDLTTLNSAALEVAQGAVVEGLLYADMMALGKAVLTPRGRLLADGLVARMWM
jgi:oxygen-independent coproporphyrinogen-3 oxidase